MLARSLRNLIAIVEDFKGRGVNFRSLTEEIEFRGVAHCRIVEVILRLAAKVLDLGVESLAPEDGGQVWAILHADVRAIVEQHKGRRSHACAEKLPRW